MSKEACDKARREFVASICKRDLGREPTEQELRTMGRLSYEAGWNAGVEYYKKLSEMMNTPEMEKIVDVVDEMEKELRKLSMGY